MEHNAHDLAMKYLNTRDRTSHEIKVYLASKGISGEEIRECLEYLFQCGFINDDDYCERYILYGMEKGRGPLLLEKELSDKGISQEILRPALDAHFGSGGERKAAMAYVEKLLKQADYIPVDSKQVNGPDYAGEPEFFKEAAGSDFHDEAEFAEETARPSMNEKELARIGRRLASKGYHSHVIYDILGKLRS